jgi:hypothetical protein
VPQYQVNVTYADGGTDIEHATELSLMEVITSA